jgi:hypothetical protein
LTRRLREWGNVGTIDVFDVQKQLLDARSDLEPTKPGAAANLITLCNVPGGGWQSSYATGDTALTPRRSRIAVPSSSLNSFSKAPRIYPCGTSFVESSMKSLVRSFFIIAAMAAPALSHAQESTPGAQSTQSPAVTSGYGGTASGKDQAGSQQRRSGFSFRNGGSKSSDNCTGPVSYCSIFFGS